MTRIGQIDYMPQNLRSIVYSRSALKNLSRSNRTSESTQDQNQVTKIKTQ